MRSTLLLALAVFASFAFSRDVTAQDTDTRVSAISTAIASVRQGLPGKVNLILPSDSVLAHLDAMRAAKQLGYAVTEHNQTPRSADVHIKVGAAAITAGDAKFMLHVTGNRGMRKATSTREVTLTRVNGKWSVRRSRLVSIT